MYQCKLDTTEAGGDERLTFLEEIHLLEYQKKCAKSEEPKKVKPDRCL